MKLFLILTVLLAVAAHSHASYDDVNKLHKDLLEHYEKDTAPHHTNVSFGLNIQCGRYCQHTKRFFTSVWERYEWKDDRLAWDPSEHGGIKDIKLCPNDLWLPDLRLYLSSNPKEERGHVRILVDHTGTAHWVVPALYENFCKKTGDHVHCNYKIGSWVYSDNDIHLNSHSLGVDSLYHDQHCPYTPTVKNVEIKSETYPCCPESYSALQFEVDYAEVH